MNSNLLRGSLDTIILKLLADHGELYGYEITQKVKDLTKGEISITDGALYPLLHKLEAKNVLQAETRSIGNRYRKYYKLTPKGNQEVESLLTDMKSYLHQMTLLLFPKSQTI
jgi:PadR family transcriptional regulator, regulatory protein PadR